MDTIKTADITVWRMMTNYFAPETLCEIHHSKRRMTIVISYLYITVFVYLPGFDRDRFFFCGFQRFFESQRTFGDSLNSGVK
ncbi:hypothetical protein SEPB56_09408 [Salmonella enterica subsp. enterica serovar Paratyphi B str. SARA56]|nr:hypothetical protein SEPB56_09408 [Salmonella enterica subsp. enterica serovar Paratyphi B str. SARA56]